MTLQKALVWLLYSIIGLLFFSVLAGVIFFAWNSFNLDSLRPWSWWEYLYYLRAEEAYRLPFIVSGLLPAILVALVALGPIYKPKDVFGDARWSKPDEQKKAGLSDAKGILLGRINNRFLCSDTATHTLLCGPTRAGKGTGVVIPNCLNWTGSLVVLDVKTENYRITSGFRKSFGHAVYLWSPMSKDGRSHRFNPLDMVSPIPAHRVTDVQNMATMLVDVSEKDPMWGQEARALFVALTLFVLETQDTKSLGEVYRWLCSQGDLRDRCEDLIATYSELSPTCRQGLHSFAAKNTKEAASVRSNLTAALRLFANPTVDAATEASDFSIRDLRRKKMSIYVGAMASQLDTLAPLLRLFFQQCMAVMSENDPGKDEPHKVLMLLDEFVSLGRMDAIVSAFTLLAGYNVRVLAVIQGLSWLDNNYGRDTREGLISCCGNQVFMTTNDETTTAYVSGALGEKTVTTQSVSRRMFSFSTNDSPSRNMSATARPLLSKQGVRRLDRNQQVIITEGHRPTLATKIRYFKDRVFKKRLLDPHPIPLLDLERDHKLPEDQEDGSTPVMPSPVDRNGLYTGADDEGGTGIDNDDITGNSNLSTSQQATYDALKAQLLSVLEEEARENPQFAKAQEEQLKILKINEMSEHHV